MILKTIKLLSRLTLKEFKINDNKFFKIDNKAYEIFQNLFKFERSKNKESKNSTHVKTIEKSIFVTFNARITLNYL